MNTGFLKKFLLSAALLSAVTTIQAQFVAVNDQAAGPDTYVNATRYHYDGLQDGSNGRLKNLATGQDLDVFMSITELSPLVVSPAKATPIPGTPLANTFVGLVDFESELTESYTLAPNNRVTVTLTGLDNAFTYTIQGGHRAGSSLANQYTLVTLVSADSFASVHTPVSVTSAFTNAIPTNAVAINTGSNLTGDMFHWENVRPGADRTIRLTYEIYQGRLPSGLNAFFASYMPSAFRIQQEVAERPNIISQDTVVAVDVGETAFMTAIVGGYPVAYNWQEQVDGTFQDIDGANGTSYGLPNVTLADSGRRFRLRVSNSMGATVSRDMVLIVLRPDQTLVPFTQVWRYDDSGTDLGTAWREVNYNDASWASAAAPLGVEGTAINPPLNPNNGVVREDGKITYYFRTKFFFDGVPSEVALTMTTLLDDGAIFWLNGEEMLRVRMNDGNADYLTLANATVGDAGQEVWEIGSSNLVSGTNVLAVEVHQTSATSSDIVMAAEIVAQYEAPTPFSIVQQPVDTDATVLKVAELSVGVQGAGVRYRWFFEDMLIPGADRPVLRFNEIMFSDAGEYYVEVFSAFGTVQSRRVMLNVFPDTNGPIVLDADGSLSSTNILVMFDERVTKETAEDISNYRLTTTLGGDLAIISAVHTNGTNVLLTTAPRVNVNTNNYMLELNGISDIINPPTNNIIAMDTLAPVSRIVTLIGIHAIWDFYNPFPFFPLEQPLYPGDGWNTDFNFDIVGGEWGIRSPAPFIYTADINAELPVDRSTETGLGQGSQTKYFRTGFNYTASPLGASFQMKQIIDDGAAFYFNGQEFYRNNLPLGPLDPLTDPIVPVGLPPLVDLPNIPTDLLRLGTNLMAVELHGTSDVDLDWVFGMEFTARVKSVGLGPVMITKHLQDLEVVENDTARFTFDGAGPLFFQWYLDDMPILGGTNAILNIPFVKFNLDGAQIRVVASNLTEVAESGPVTMTVIPDFAGPRILSALSGSSLDSIVVAFDEPIDPATGSMVGNYQLVDAFGNVINVNSAMVQNLTNVVLATGPLPLGGAVLTINGIRDTAVAMNPIIPGSSVEVGFEGTLLAIDATWRYDQSLTDLSGTTWNNINYSDGSWSTGQGAFAFPEGENLLGEPVNTELDLQNGGTQILTTYFRARFSLPSTVRGIVTASNVVDDGAVFYMNGNEVARVRMPAPPNPITYDTLANLGGAGGDVSDRGEYDVFEVPASAFVAGTNVFAVEVHQVNATSSDVAFGSKLHLSVPSRVLPPPPCEPMITRMSDGSVEISWMGGCMLLEADSPEGPYREVENQGSPLILTAEQLEMNGSKFYKMQLPF